MAKAKQGETSRNELIDDVCEAFQQQWEDGANPRIEDLLEQVPDKYRDEALRELIALEIELCQAAGRPEPKDLCERFGARIVDAARALANRERDEGVAFPETESTSPEREREDKHLEPRLPTDDAAALEPASSSNIAFLDGRYRLIREIARGAFGIVYLARDEELKRDVAVKMLHSTEGDDPDRMNRLREEARRLASLNHRHIVPIYDVERDQNEQWYIVAKYIESGNLSSKVEAEAVPLREAVHIAACVADALHHAHQMGLVHRDVKPANVLLDSQGEPLLTDFGLALHEDQQRQRRNELAGSPPYMAPEQTEGKSQHLDGRTDIWALGVMLYEMLAGRKPFAGDSREELFEEIREREPKPPRQIDDSIPDELQRIVLKCLAKNIADRYPTAADVATDLRAWQTDQDAAGSANNTLGFAKVMTIVIGLAALTGMALILTGVFGPRQRNASEPNSAGAVSATGSTRLPSAATLNGDVNVLVWRFQQFLPIEHPQARPVKNGDKIRIEATVNQPAHLYLALIDATGHAQPFYPGTPGDWREWNRAHEPTRRAALPEAADGAWPVIGEAGMETVLMLARETPLPGDIPVEDLFAGLPRQTSQDGRALAFFDKGLLSQRKDRGLDFFQEERVNDPVLRTQRLLQERLADHFSLILAVAFAHQDEQE